MQKIENIWPVDEFFFHRKFLYYDDFFPTVVFDPNEVSNWNEMKTRKTSFCVDAQEKEMLFEDFTKCIILNRNEEKKGQPQFQTFIRSERTPPSLFTNEEKRIESNRLKSIQKASLLQLQNGSFVKVDFYAKKGMKYKRNLRDRLHTQGSQ